MQNGTCSHKTLVRGPLGQIDHCAHCGTLNVHIGFMSLRLPADAARFLHQMLGEALEGTSQPGMERDLPERGLMS